MMHRQRLPRQSEFTAEQVVEISLRCTTHVFITIANQLRQISEHIEQFGRWTHDCSMLLKYNQANRMTELTFQCDISQQLRNGWQFGGDVELPSGVAQIDAVNCVASVYGIWEALLTVDPIKTQYFIGIKWRCCSRRSVLERLVAEHNKGNGRTIHRGKTHNQIKLELAVAKEKCEKKSCRHIKKRVVRHWRAKLEYVSLVWGTLT